MNDALADIPPGPSRPETATPRRRRTAAMPAAGLAAVSTAAGLAVAATVVVLAAAGHGPAARWLLTAASVALGAASAIPSIQAIAADPASLRPVTWGVWTALTTMAALASATHGDYPSAIFSLVGTTTCATVTLIALRRGRHALTRLDALCLLLAITGLAGWQTLRQPDLAVLAACAGDLAALTPTIAHAWLQPHEEPAATFALIATGGLCAAAAAWGHWTITALAYPLYVAASTSAVALLASRRPDHVTENPDSQPARETS